MRLAALGLLHETNTFSPNPTGADDFPLMPVGADAVEHRRDHHRRSSCGTSMPGRRRPSAGFHAADSLPGVEVVPLVFATTPPSGTISRDAFEKVAGHILDGARRGGARSMAC